MFRSAVFKLTAWYVGALLLVCLLFSLPMYSVASTRLRQGAERQTAVVRDLPDPLVPDRIVRLLERQRESQLADDRHQLLLTLFFINAVIIGAGGIASYWFARRTLQPLEAAHAAQTRFTADASHELRTPLAIMQTEIEVALRSKNLPLSEAKEILASNLEEVARLRQLSDQLLGLTRSDAEAISLVKTNLTKLIRDQMKTLAKRYNIPIPVVAEQAVYVEADKLLIAQVLGILAENAVTYSGLKNPELKVVVALIGDTVTIDVSNQGAVIAKKDILHLFDRFYRGTEATKFNPKGHGLGLSLAKDIVTRHGGTIDVISSAKGGTQFTISLPSMP